MSAAVIELYNTLTEEAQKEVYDFMLFLVHKKESVFGDKIKLQKKNDRKKALYEFAGSKKNSFGTIDGLDYQNKLREERSFV